MQVSYCRKTRAQTDADCYLCENEKICKTISSIEGIIDPPAFSLIFECEHYRSDDTDAPESEVTQ